MSSPLNAPGTERLVCGYPKTGRTWLRFMLASALSRKYNLDVSVTLSNAYSIVPNDAVAQMDGQPDFVYHDIIPHIQMSHKKYDSALHMGRRLVFLTRDPRDIMVSHWHHDKNQVHLFDGGLASYIRDPTFGIDAFLDHLESWAPNLSEGQINTYEQMRACPDRAMSNISRILELGLSGEEIADAVEAGAIDRMRSIEVVEGIAGQHYDRTDPNARRVREGKVGGFSSYIEGPELHYIDDAIRGATTAAQAIIGLTPYYE